MNNLPINYYKSSTVYQCIDYTHICTGFTDYIKIGETDCKGIKGGTYKYWLKKERKKKKKG